MDSSQQAPLDHVDTSAYLPVAMRRGARACVVRHPAQPQQAESGDESDGDSSSAGDSDGDENSSSSEDDSRGQRRGGPAAAAAGGGGGGSGTRGARRRAQTAANDTSTQTALHAPYSHLVVGQQAFSLKRLCPAKQLFTDKPFHLNSNSLPVQLSVTVHPDDWNVQEYVLSQQQPGVVNGGGQQQQQSAGQQTAPVAAAAASSSTTFGPYSATLKLNTASRQLRLTDLQHSGQMQRYSSKSYTIVLQERVPVAGGANSPPHVKLHIKPGKGDGKTTNNTKTIIPAGAGVGLQIFPGSVTEVAEAGSVTTNMCRGKPSSLRLTIPKALICSQLPQLAGEGASAPRDMQVKVVEQDSAGGQRTAGEWQLKLYKTTATREFVVHAPPSHALSAYAGRSISRVSLTPDKQLTMTYAAQQTQAAAGTSGAPAGAAAAAASGGTQLPPPDPTTTTLTAAATAQAAAAGGPEGSATALTAVFAAQPTQAGAVSNKLRRSSNNHTAAGGGGNLSAAQHSEQAVRFATAPPVGGGVQPAGLLLPPPAAAAAPSAGQHSRDPRRRVSSTNNSSQQQPTGAVTPQPAATQLLLPGVAQLPAAVDRPLLAPKTVQLPHKRVASSITQADVQRQQDGGTGVGAGASAEADAAAAAAAGGGTTALAAGSSRKKPRVASGQQQQQGSRRSSSTVAVDNTTPAAAAMDVDSRVEAAVARGHGGDRSAFVYVAGSQAGAFPKTALNAEPGSVPPAPTPVTPAAPAPVPAAVTIKQEPVVMDLTGADSDEDEGEGGQDVGQLQQQQQQQQEAGAAAAGRGTAVLLAPAQTPLQNTANASAGVALLPPSATPATAVLPSTLQLLNAPTAADMERQLLRLMSEGLMPLLPGQRYAALLDQLDVLFEPFRSGGSNVGGSNTRLELLQCRYIYLQGAVRGGQLLDVLRKLEALLAV